MVNNTLKYLYTNWAYMCLPIALYTSLLLFSCSHALQWIIVLIWLQFPAYLIHQFEEHAYPGGFQVYMSNLIGIQSNAQTTNKIFWINSICIWLLFPVIAILAQHYALSVGVLLPIFSLINAMLHVVFFIKKRKYNPGVFISLTLNIPLALYTLWYMYHIQLLTTENLSISIIATLLIHSMIMGLLRTQKNA